MAKKKAKSKPKKKTSARKAAKKSAAPKAAKRPAAKTKAKAKKKAKAAKAPELPWRQPLAGEKLVGIVDDFFADISVITMVLSAPLKVGDRIHVRGHTTDITEPVNSMQIEHVSVQNAEKGAALGIKVGGKCRRGDYVYKVS